MLRGGDQLQIGHPHLSWSTPPSHAAMMYNQAVHTSFLYCSRAMGHVMPLSARNLYRWLSAPVTLLL